MKTNRERAATGEGAESHRERSTIPFTETTHMLHRLTGLQARDQTQNRIRATTKKSEGML